MEKINSSSWKAFSLSFCMAMTACAGGQDVPTQGRLVDKVTPASSYPVAPTTQALLDPANNSVTGVLVAPEVTAYPQGIIDRLLATWTGPKPDAKVWLVPEDSFTSDVSSNGAIFLNTGLIRYFHDHADVQKEDALAFVLAHEVSHILLGHTAAKLSTKKIKNYSFSALKWGSIVGRVAGGAGATGAAAKAIVSSIGAKAFADTALFPSWSREQEEQADALAIDLMARAGYSINAASDVMDILVADDEQTAAIQAKAQAAAAASKEDQVFTQDAFTLKAKSDDALGGAIISGLNGLTQEHPHAKERRIALAAYTRQAYPVRPHSLIQRAPMQHWLKSRPVTTLLAQITELARASDAVKALNWSAAQKSLARIGYPVKNSEYYAYLASHVALSLGQTSQALAILSTAAHKGEVTFQVAIDWGTLLSSNNHMGDAEKYMAEEQEAMNNYGFLPYRIINANREKNGILLTQLTVMCEGVGDEKLEASCSDAEKKN